METSGAPLRGSSSAGGGGGEVTAGGVRSQPGGRCEVTAGGGEVTAGGRCEVTAGASGSVVYQTVETKVRNISLKLNFTFVTLNVL